VEWLESAFEYVFTPAWEKGVVRPDYLAKLGAEQEERASRPVSRVGNPKPRFPKSEDLAENEQASSQ